MTICAARFEPRRRMLVVSTPERAANTIRVDADLFAADRSPEALRDVKVLEPFMREAGDGLALYSVEIDSATAALILRGHLFDAEIIGAALDRAIALVRTVCRVELGASRAAVRDD